MIYLLTQKEVDKIIKTKIGDLKISKKNRFWIHTNLQNYGPRLTLKMIVWVLVLIQFKRFKEVRDTDLDLDLIPHSLIKSRDPLIADLALRIIKRQDRVLIKPMVM